MCTIVLHTPLKNRDFIYFYEIIHKLINKSMWISFYVDIVDISTVLPPTPKVLHGVIHRFLKKLSIHFHTEKILTQDRRIYEN